MRTDVPTNAVVELSRGWFANERSGLVVIDLGHYHPELRDRRDDR